MVELRESQFIMLREYAELLSTMSEGFDYLEFHLQEEESPQVAQLFNDLLSAIDQLSKCHQQMTVIFPEDETIQKLFDDWKGIVQIMSEWFMIETNSGRGELFTEQVIPAFETWKLRIQRYLKPYITH